MNKFVEIRSYNLKPGTRSWFATLMNEEALPMLQRWKVDVVRQGPSSHDQDTYYLIRAYESWLIVNGVRMTSTEATNGGRVRENASWR